MRLKQIQGYDHYLVSDEGTVISLRFNKCKWLKPHTHPKGYLQVALWKEGGQKTFWVHKLVLDAFDRPRAISEVCLHEDDDPANNRLDNIRWGTPKENSAQMVAHGRSWKGRFSPEEFEEMRTMPGTQTEVAKKFGVNPSYISMIRSGRRGV